MAEKLSVDMLIKTISKVLYGNFDNLHNIKPTDSFNQLEFDSMSLIELILSLQDQLGVKIPLDIIYKGKNIALFCEAINSLLEKHND